MTRAPVTPPELRQSQVLSVDLSDNEADYVRCHGGGWINQGYTMIYLYLQYNICIYIYMYYIHIIYIYIYIYIL